MPLVSTGGTRATGLPPDLVAQSARRLRIQALLYAFAFFMAGLLPVFLFADSRLHFFASPLRWAPTIGSLAVALGVVAATLSTKLSPSAVMAFGLIFQVVGSVGIAMAQYLDVTDWQQMPPWAGLSWVAVWILGFTVTVPTPPRQALIASLASASTVPLLVGMLMATGVTPIRLHPVAFFFMLILPYLIVVVMAYVSARVVYNLGTALTRARDLGSYSLVERLGQGGMGEVWRAEHRLLARPAAVKLIRPEMIEGIGPDRRAEFLQRFEREAQATASLRSPHTVELYDFGVADDGTLYYVMELLDGFDLGTLVDRFGPVPAERAVHLLVQMCHSLAEAHAQGLIHRDVKPANVYVCRHGRDVDFVKVLDFGLVKSLGQDSRTEMDLTRGLAVRGTPAFMAPEQALGDRPLDGRTDLYALGCVAYWLVTGQRVFSGTASMEVLVQHVQTQPTPPSARTEMPIPPALERLILACLEKSPDDRPASADEVLARLERATPAAWTGEQMHAWWDRHAPAKKSGRLS